MTKIKEFKVKDEDDLLEQLIIDKDLDQGWELVIPYPYLKKMINEIWNEDEFFKNVDKRKLFNYIIYKDNKYRSDKYKNDKELRNKIRNIMILISIYYVLQDIGKKIRNMIFSLESR